MNFIGDTPELYEGGFLPAVATAASRFWAGVDPSIPTGTESEERIYITLGIGDFKNKYHSSKFIGVCRRGCHVEIHTAGQGKGPRMNSSATMCEHVFTACTG